MTKHLHASVVMVSGVRVYCQEQSQANETENATERFLSRYSCIWRCRSRSFAPPVETYHVTILVMRDQARLFIEGFQNTFEEHFETTAVYTSSTMRFG